MKARSLFRPTPVRPKVGFQSHQTHEQSNLGESVPTSTGGETAKLVLALLIAGILAKALTSAFQ